VPFFTSPQVSNVFFSDAEIRRRPRSPEFKQKTIKIANRGRFRSVRRYATIPASCFGMAIAPIAGTMQINTTKPGFAAWAGEFRWLIGQIRPPAFGKLNS
jgi:hypothetical protein